MSTNVDFEPWLGRPQVSVSPCLPPDDQGPLTSNVTANPNPVPVGTNVSLAAKVDDSTTGGSDIASAEYSLDGGPWTLMDAQDDTFDAVTEDVSVTFTAPTIPGVYDLCVRGTDSANKVGAEECILLVVYDPLGGFVTGGGWINSPSGAYTAEPLLTGKATFGFVSKYQKGAKVPTGQTEFQFRVANINFKSTAYEWLVVAGARAQYKGSGTINGSGDYDFILTAIDGQTSGGGGIDKFRIKIWDSGGIVYDNKHGAADSANDLTELGGGSIVIHK